MSASAPPWADPLTRRPRGRHARRRAVRVVPSTLPDRPVGRWAGLLFVLRGTWSALAAVLALTVLDVVVRTASLVATVAAAGYPEHRGRLLAAAAGALLLTVPVGAASDRLSGRAQDRVEERVELALWTRMVRLPPPFLLGAPLRTLLGWAGAVGLVRSVSGTLGVDALLGGLVTTVCAAALLAVDPLVGAVAVLLAVAAVALALVCGVRQQRHDRTVLRAVDEVQALLHTVAGGYDELATLRAQHHALRRWREAFDRQKDADERGLRWAAPGEALLAALAPVLLAVLVPLVLRGGGPDSGQRLALVVVVVAQLAGGAARLAAGLPGLLAVGLAHDRLRPVLATVPERRDPPVAGTTRTGGLRGEVVLRDISFTYPGSSTPVLDGVSARIPAGTCVAVVGGSGSGKSTLLRLLLGLLEPDRGEVLFDGRPAAGLDPEEVRRQTGYVPQGAGLLRGSVREFLTGGQPADEAPGDAALQDAVVRAGLAADLRDLPMGLDTRIGAVAGDFSGGQVQRLLLARALLRRPRILLLDEATSALDEAAEGLVVAAVAGLRLTRVVVAHRLSTIVAADHVLVLHRGRVLDEGRFEELLPRCAVFADLVADTVTDPVTHDTSASEPHHTEE